MPFENLFKETLLILCNIYRLPTNGSKEELAFRLEENGFNPLMHPTFVTYCKSCDIHVFTNRIIPQPCTGCGVSLVGWRVR